MLLNGSELAGFIKERQAAQVKRLKAMPKLAIVLATEDPASQTYTVLKQNYGREIGVRVEIHRISAAEAKSKILELNNNPLVSAIIVQLPLPAGVDTTKTLNLVAGNKDVDGLGKNAKFEPATPTAILWLLAGYNVDLRDKSIAIIGKGRLVGEPLYKILKRSHKNVRVYDEGTPKLEEKIKTADIIISAAGQPKLLTDKIIKDGAVIIDASTASEKGKLVGDVDPALYKRPDVKVSPVPGGVGPLTVSALFENVIQAAKGK